MQNKNSHEEARLHIRLNLNKERESQIYDFLSQLPNRTKSTFILNAIYAAMQQESIQTSIENTIRNTIKECLFGIDSSPTPSTKNIETDQEQKENTKTKQPESAQEETKIDENILADMSNFFD